jgi:hypothetical protein
MNKLIAALLLIASVNASAAGFLTCRSGRTLAIDGPRGTMTITNQTYTVDVVKGKIRGDYITMDPQPLVLLNSNDSTIIAADGRGTTVMVVRHDLTFTLMQAGTEVIWGTCVKPK